MKARISIVIDKALAGICLISAILLLVYPFEGRAQESPPIELFELKDVSLHQSPFKNAEEVSARYIMELDPDKLLSPFLREAGLQPKAQSYTNWENSGLDGHVGGHYLTALAQLYASTKNQQALERLEYMLTELKRAQDAYGNGYIGGVPGSKELWKEIKAGAINPGNFNLNNRWVPLYNIHKTYAGLLDAHRLTGNELSLEMLLDYTDWMIDITGDLSDEQMQNMLISEHGGLNEVFAQVAALTGEKKYLDLAYRFSHQAVLDPLTREQDELSGMHANTQIPKVIGFEAISVVANDPHMHQAAKFFWETVVENRTVAIGGNSVREHFHPPSDFSSMITDVQGPETCNTYNMLKLSKQLFQAEGDQKYIDYYEQALYNHILSSQHPETGGFVYFTPMRPGHYRVYSQPHTSFWCCVGSGLENHSKYNELIYAHSGDALYVNLYIPSTLRWEEKGLELSQHTDFPSKEPVSFEVTTTSPQRLNLKLRYPSWVAADALEITVNGEDIKVNARPGSFVSVEREWKNGDKIQMSLPMHLEAVPLPDGSNYQALKYGPVVLAAKTGTQDLLGLYADDSRGGHIAHGSTIPLTQMPMLVTTEKDITPFIKKVPGKDLTFSASDLIQFEAYKDLELIPFYQLHDARYAIYFPVETPQGAAKIQKELEERERLEKEMEALTIDWVAPGEQQPESDHFVQHERSNTGVHLDRHWRDAEGWFSYELKDPGKEAASLRLTYFRGDQNRKFKILVNGKEIAREHFDGKRKHDFFWVDYALPPQIVEDGEGSLRVRIEAEPGSRTAGVYQVRLLREK